MLCYPAVLFPPDEEGISGCIVPDMSVNAAGATPDDALGDAVGMMEELLGDMVEDGEPFPDPTPIDAFDDRGGRVVMLQAPIPKRIPTAA